MEEIKNRHLDRLANGTETVEQLQIAIADYEERGWTENNIYYQACQAALAEWQAKQQA